MLNNRTTSREVETAYFNRFEMPKFATFAFKFRKCDFMLFEELNLPGETEI
jgi:hypothetical protein